MGSFLMPKKPDTSRQEALLAKQEAATTSQENQVKAQQAAALRARSGRANARNSLITGGNETGVQPARTTLG